MKKGDRNIFWALFAISTLFLAGCSVVDKDQFTANSSENSTMEKPQDASLPNLPGNIFEEIGHNEPDNPELDDPNIRIIPVRMFQFGFDPEIIEVEKGNRVILTITSADVGHGFALPEFGINKQVPPEETVKVDFIADMEGEFEFFESVYSGKSWKDMKGKFIVLPTPSEQGE